MATTKFLRRKLKTPKSRRTRTCRRSKRTARSRRCMRGGRRNVPTGPSIEGFPYVGGDDIHVVYPGGSLPIAEYRAAAAAGELESQN